MRPHRNPPASCRRPLRALAGTATALALSLTLPATAARAEEAAAPATVVGEIVQAWPEAGPAGSAAETEHAEAPLTWVESPTGEAVRVPTEAVASLAGGSTVEVTGGAQLSHAPGPGG